MNDACTDYRTGRTIANEVGRVSLGNKVNYYSKTCERLVVYVTPVPCDVRLLHTRVRDINPLSAGRCELAVSSECRR